MQVVQRVGKNCILCVVSIENCVRLENIVCPLNLVSLVHRYDCSDHSNFVCVWIDLVPSTWL